MITETFWLWTRQIGAESWLTGLRIAANCFNRDNVEICLTLWSVYGTVSGCMLLISYSDILILLESPNFFHDRMCILNFNILISSFKYKSLWFPFFFSPPPPFILFNRTFTFYSFYLNYDLQTVNKKTALLEMYRLHTYLTFRNVSIFQLNRISFWCEFHM